MNKARKSIKKAKKNEKSDEKEIEIDLSGIIKNPWRTVAVILGIILIVMLTLQLTGVTASTILPSEFQNVVNEIYKYYPDHLELIIYLFGSPIRTNTFNETLLNNSMTNDIVNIKFIYSPRSVSSLRVKAFTINDLEALLGNRTNIEYVNAERIDLQNVNETILKYIDYVSRVPALVINDKYVVNGEIDTSAVLRLVCDEYALKPQVCLDITNSTV